LGFSHITFVASNLIINLKKNQTMKSFKKNAARLFVLITIVKNLPLIVVLLAKKSWNTLTLCDDAQHVHTSANPLTNTPPVTDAALHAQATTTLNVYDAFKATPPTATKTQVTTQRNILINMFNKVAMYVQGVARDAATTAGDVTAGITVVTSVGLKIKKAKSAISKAFKVVQAGIGAVDVTTKAVDKRAGYLREYGITPTKGVVPTTLQETAFSLGSSIHINGLTSGAIYGFREATILPVKRTPGNSTTPIGMLKTLTPTGATSKHKVIFTQGVSHYTWSDWVYVVIL
jgi:hypothetical protein